MTLKKSPLNEAQVLAWADDHLNRTGEWPKTDFGHVLANPNEKWLNVDMALRVGLRGLPGGDSLARLLDAWAAQLHIQAEARVLLSGSEHRRFLLLNDGHSIILGPSLNSLHKNEAVSIEDDKEDRPF